MIPVDSLAPDSEAPEGSTTIVMPKPLGAVPIEYVPNGTGDVLAEKIRRANALDTPLALDVSAYLRTSVREVYAIGLLPHGRFLLASRGYSQIATADRYEITALLANHARITSQWTGYELCGIGTVETIWICHEDYEEEKRDDSSGPDREGDPFLPTVDQLAKHWGLPPLKGV